jgi:hypothetical protein
LISAKGEKHLRPTFATIVCNPTHRYVIIFVNLPGLEHPLPTWASDTHPTLAYKCWAQSSSRGLQSDTTPHTTTDPVLLTQPQMSAAPLLLTASTHNDEMCVLTSNARSSYTKPCPALPATADDPHFYVSLAKYATESTHMPSVATSSKPYPVTSENSAKMGGPSPSNRQRLALTK